MMIAPPGYTLGKIIYSGEQTIVYQSIRECDRQKVVIKTIQAEFPTVEQTTRLKQEYQILVNLHVAGVIQAYKLEKYQKRVALILEDISGESLKTFFVGRLRLTDWLHITIQIASILGEIHQQQIIHKDIKPKNILITPNQQIKIIDFSISSRLSKENPSLSPPSLLEGSLAYISPEQTGRMNRVVDYRSDLYSLGVTFYELLTGNLPFTSNDPLEVIHSHIAKQPIAPHQLQPDIPVAISNIIMKLLAKNAEDRYQSAFGVKRDLEATQAQLTATGKIEEFPLGQQDISGQLLIPQKLYGRETEVGLLLSAFHRVLTGLHTELLLVTGYSGIGKSSLVNEIHKPILQQRGYFIAGKFDQFQRDVPYASLIQAFRVLIGQLLAESATSLQAWKIKLRQALRENSQIIIEVIPEIELILGSQPPVPILGATEAQARFHRVFIAFIQVFAQAEHPLVLFLDDLQWADSPSLKFIQALMTDTSIGYLLLLGAYRDHEVSLGHPLIQTKTHLEEAGVVVNEILLQPLGLDSVKQLVADTLQETETSQSLAGLVYNKTYGNPFFVTQLLQSLAQTNLIEFNLSIGLWTWDLAQIQTVDVTNNVVDLMVSKIQRLPIATQMLLRFAACIGYRFDLETLAVISNKSVLEAAAEIWLAMQTGLVLPESNAYKIPLVVGEATVVEILNNNAISYKFLHDRVQQAAYTLIPEAERKATHLKIGHRLQQSQSPEEQKENIFELVNQLNYGKDLISNQQEKNQLAALNLIAGAKAKASVAYEPAARYFNLGLELLADDGWHEYELTLDLYESAIDAECINANYWRSQSLIDLALGQTKTLLDQIRIYKQQIQLSIARGDSAAAIEIALNALELLDVPIPTNLADINIYTQTLRQKLIFQPHEVAPLANLPVMSDANKRAAMEILNTMPGPVYIARPQLFLPMMLTMTDLSVEYGNWVPSSFAYCTCGFIFSEVFGDTETGYEFGLLSLRMLEKFNDKTLYPRVLKVYGSHIHPMKSSLRSTLNFLQSSINSSVELGNLEFLGYGASEYTIYYFFSGENLETVNQKVLPYVEMVEGAKQDLGIYYIRIAQQVVLNFIGYADDPLVLTGESFNEVTMLPLVKAANWQTLLFCFDLFKLMLAYQFAHYDQALIHAESAAANLPAVVGMIMGYEYNFYHSLALLAHKGEDALLQVQANQKILKRKAYYAPMNFQHKYELVEAEIARVNGQILVAMDAYDASIQSARDNEYAQDEALANELAAKFYLAINKPKIATAYLNDAYLGYISWGSKAKAEDLLTSYPEMLTSYRQNQVSKTSITSSLSSAASLDLSTVVKASQAIARELVLENLLNSLIAIVLENAAAQRGFLIAQTSGEFTVVASAISDMSLSQSQTSPVIELEDEDNATQLPLSILNYVVRTRESVVLNHATSISIFTNDPYILAHQPKSVLCTPIIYQGKLKNLLYLENYLTTGAFTVERLEILKLLSAQIAVSLENAQLYQNLEQYNQTLEASVAKRTQELEEKNICLEKTTVQLSLVNNELESFSSSVSHDLRSPLRRIDNFTQMLRESADHLSAKEQDYLHRIQTSTQNMRRLIEDLLRLSQLSRCELHQTHVNVSKIVQKILQDLQKDQPRVALFQITPDLTTFADAYLLEAALENILGNAWKYTRERECTEIEFGKLDSGVFFIRDNGVGFDMNDSEKLFQPFQRLHSATKFEGSGVGLATVERIIHRHGGRIWAQAAIDAGSTFYFTLN